ncbi:hypothetical protein, partial [Bacillus sp. 3255]|uniref:hypothetical protein n=1 Tax=Bacillus sp. 3255 TaxID=2817904 RepID=UPI00286C2D58
HSSAPVFTAAPVHGVRSTAPPESANGHRSRYSAVLRRSRTLTDTANVICLDQRDSRAEIGK